ncbi:cytochrome ubiquinol oxidase subunit I [Ammoniphilus sp. CFH 90114]|uniref:cytochrome ubiquinol oxidase subunit I n=1 Tax=Ammoniphilus sp. CFH 90114 TaxID=2493665 RepID=UPI00100E45FB|nr:cytochrome ubiquinol oxidase subunit I [Ammoniphilus sp. CFH 90114]RXT07836.1 cytochrome ubiquinol oxidase subunit I [Ammoniphilus sp. CFH 90114]
MEWDTFMLSRLLTSMTLGFHIIFATIGVGVPLLICLAEWWGIRKNDPHYILLARRWARGFVITVAIGVVTGTCIGLQLSLLWPSFMQIAGQVIGLPLFLETFAFFFEAIFLGIYLYTWDRFKNPWIHWSFSIPVVIGSAGSAFFITTVNAFMNTPTGFTLENGMITAIEPWKAMFNPATPTKVLHVLASAYLTSAFILGSIAGFQLLKGRRHVYYRKALTFTMFFCLLFGILTAVIGDFSGKFLAEYQPEKLAAAEWHFHTERNADLILGGYLTEENEVRGAIRIPYALSLLAYGNPTAEVKGLHDFQRELWPPLFIHYLFDLMVGIGIYLIIVPIVYFYFLMKKNRMPNGIYRFIIAGGPLAMLAIEAGWIFTEAGRQPWILRGYMKTAHGVTTASNVGEMLFLFSLLYGVLAVTCIGVLLRLYRNNTAEAEIIRRGIG